MKVGTAEFEESIESAECLLDELTNAAAEDIDIFEDSGGEGKALSAEEFADQLRDKRDNFRDVLKLTKNVCPLVRECAALIDKHPREGRAIAAVLNRMGFEVGKK